ncbi:hypothetical protein QN277_028364 [Acacia crassicarpa]|uniref:NAB domain-containing protein n=1 Tax=Acacia crassicarpa TaxID=499986 RepID=A0AAE1J5N2_9FABA|nr:hypothetical protein QN277_028364 [Acacia crassicarpa]
MIKHRLRGLSTILGNQIEPEKIEELKRSKTNIENNLSKILKIIKNEDKGNKTDRNPKRSKQEAELEGLIEDFFSQYQSLYALFDRLTAENGKVVSRRTASLSRSSSGSDYFSSEEVETQRNSTEAEQHHHFTILDPIRVEGNENESEIDLHARAISSRGKEVETEQLRIESRESEAQELRAENAEFQVLLKMKEDQASDLQRKIQDYDQQMNTLTMTAKTPSNQKDEMEAKSALSRDEVLGQMEGLRDQLNVMHQNLESLSDKNKELESQMEYLNQQLVEKGLLERRMREQNEGFAGRVKDLEMELESRSKEKDKLEDELRQKNYEIKQLGDENKSLEDSNEALSSKFNDLKLESDYYEEEKNELELQKERIQKEYSDSLAVIFDQEITIRKQAQTIERLSGEVEESKMWAKKFKLNKQLSEKRIEEIAEEVRGQLEDSIRILYRRIRVAEQLHNENKDGHKEIRERYEQENKMLKEKVVIYEGIEASGFGASKLKPMEVVNVIELATSKLEYAQVSFMSRVSQMTEEVQNVRDWIQQRKEEMKQLKTEVDELNDLLNHKEEKVGKLEAKVSEGREENLNLMKSVTELENKVGMLAERLKEKDEELVNLGETKREAIKQLCFMNDYHRDRCEFLKGLIAKKNTITRTERALTIYM